MATNFTLTLDTTAPAGTSVSADAGAAYTITGTVTLTIATSDTPTTGYTMKIYGDVSDTADTANYRTLEANAPWISYATSKSVVLTTGDGVKTIRMKIRDDVGNTSAEFTDTITLDTSAPTPNITTAPSATKVSKVATFDTVTFGWQSDQAFDQYKIKVVPSTGSINTAGTQIPTTAGSSNVSGSAGGYPATTTITTTIKGTDLETASAGDGAKIIKVFVMDSAGNWSV